MNKKSI